MLWLWVADEWNHKEQDSNKNTQKIRTIYYVSCFVSCQLGKIYSILLIIEEVGITFSFFRAV